jgi:hypothetical protein
MRNNLLILSFLIVFVLSGYSQEKKSNELNGFSIGFQLNEYHQDFGLGINITSPYFANSIMAIRLRGNFMYFEHFTQSTSIKASYNNLTLGLVSGKTKISNSIALYGEGGLLAIFPSSDFSTNKFEIGGYGLFGFEFYFSPEFSYFLEAGGLGAGSSANKLPTNPAYSDGFLISVGFRLNFK